MSIVLCGFFLSFKAVTAGLGGLWDYGYLNDDQEQACQHLLNS